MLVSIPFSNWHQCRLVLVGSWHPSVFYWVKFRSEEVMRFIFMSLWFLSACIPFQQKVPLKIRIQRNLLLISKLSAGGILFAIHPRQTLQVHRNLHTRLFMELLNYISDQKNISDQKKRTNNSIQPQRYPKSGSTKSYYNLLWVTIIQICWSSSME